MITISRNIPGLTGTVFQITTPEEEEEVRSALNRCNINIIDELNYAKSLCTSEILTDVLDDNKFMQLKMSIAMDFEIERGVMKQGTCTAQDIDGVEVHIEVYGNGLVKQVEFNSESVQ